MTIDLLTSPSFLYPALVVIMLFALSGVSLLFSVRERRSLHKRIFLSWALGYILLIWDKVPVIMSVIGYSFLPDRVNLLYLFIFICYIAGLLLVARGFLLSFTDNKLLVDIMPILIASLGAVVTTVLFIWTGSPETGLWILKILTYLSMGFNAAAAFTLLVSGRKTVAPILPKLGLILIVLGWSVVVLSRAYLWHLLSEEPDIWLNVLLGHVNIYGALSVAGLLLLAGTILIGVHREIPPPTGTRIRTLLGIDYAAFIMFGVLTIATLYAGAMYAENTRSRFEVRRGDGGEVMVNRPFEVTLYAESKDSFNAVNGTLSLLPGMTIERISVSSSSVPFWIEDPVEGVGKQSFAFSGVIPGGVTGEVRLFNMTLNASSESRLELSDMLMFANDGKGTEMPTESHSFTVVPLSEKEVLADVNRNGRITSQDLSILVSHWGEHNVPQFDLSQNGVVDKDDIAIFLIGFSKSRVGSRAYVP